MNRRNAQLDAMLRHLGAAYYESLHGRASTSDVARALHAVGERSGEQAAEKPADAVARTGENVGQPQGHPHGGRWHRRVGDVMTASVVTVDRITPYKDIARLLTEHKVSALPVLMMGRRVAGIVSEADLLRMEDQHERRARARQRGRPRWQGRSKPWGLTAGELMTSPAITIHPGATIPAAARLMTGHQLKQLPVVDADGTLIGIVSRRDLLSVFVRPDTDIADEVRAILTDILLADPAQVNVTVEQGIVILSGHLGELERPDLISVAVRLTWDVDGVVDVVDKLAAPRPH